MTEDFRNKEYSLFNPSQQQEYSTQQVIGSKGNNPIIKAPTKTFALHGFRVKDKGEGTTNRFIPYLEEASKGMVKVVPFAYGFFGLFSVLFKNKEVASDLVKAMNGFDHYAVGHSNGCAIIVEAARQGARFKRVLLINPALKVDTIFPDTIEEVVVICTKHDGPTRWAAFADRIPFLKIFAPNAWGAMGAKGANPKLNEVISPNYPPFYRVANWVLDDELSGHSTFFKPKKLQLLGDDAAISLYQGIEFNPMTKGWIR